MSAEEPETRMDYAQRALIVLKDERTRMAKAYGDSIPGIVQLQAYDRTIASAEQRIEQMRIEMPD